MPLPNYYYPQAYQPVMPTIPQVQSSQQQQNTNVVWVQGENAAKSYPLAPGNSVLLLDSEECVMYIKSADQSGMPQPLRIFDYKERTTQATPTGTKVAEPVDYVSRSEFDEFKEEIKNSLKTNNKTTKSHSVKAGDNDAE